MVPLFVMEQLIDNLTQPQLQFLVILLRKRPRVNIFNYFVLPINDLRNPLFSSSLLVRNLFVLLCINLPENIVSYLLRVLHKIQNTDYFSNNLVLAVEESLFSKEIVLIELFIFSIVSILLFCFSISLISLAFNLSIVYFKK